MNADIENVVSTCAVCKTNSYKQQSEPLMIRPVPEHAWYRVGVDMFEYAGSSYLCAYDALSNFPEVELLRDTSSATVIDKLSAMFARYGIPIEVCTDGGPQFTSREFSNFARRYDFKHTISSPRFPRSNGLAEKGVQVVKRILKKTTEGKNDFWLGLLNYRSSPLEDGQSPGELLQGRRLRTPIPDFQDATRQLVKKHRQNMPMGTRLPPLQRGQVVRVQGDTWSTKARVISRMRPRSYVVKTEKGSVIRRNRQHLLATREPFSSSEEDASDETSDNEEPDQRQLPTGDVDGEEPVRPQLPQGHTSTPAQALRRSTRNRRRPERLAYGENFVQRP